MAVNPSEMPYPEGPAAQLARTPVVLYRMGLGPLLAERVAILSTRGRKTGLLRHTPIGYGREGDSFYAVSGWGKQSDWYKNLQADPECTLQIGSWRFAVKAEFLETPEAVQQMIDSVRAQGNTEFAALVERIREGSDEPVKAVRFVPTGKPYDGEIPTDLTWIWGALIGLVALLLLLGRKGKKKRPKTRKEKLKGRVEDAREAAKERAEEAREAVQDRAEEAREKLFKGRRKIKRFQRKATRKPRTALGTTGKMIRLAPVIFAIVRELNNREEDKSVNWVKLGGLMVAAMRQLVD